MRQSSRERQAYNNLQRTGLSIIQQPQEVNSTIYQPTIKSLGFDSMLANQPAFTQSKPQPFQYSQYYNQVADQGYRYRPESGVVNQATLYQQNDEYSVQRPQYQSFEVPKKQTDLRPYEQNKQFVTQKNDMFNQLTSLAQKSNMAQKTPEQIVNEFKAYTLPKLRLKRLVKLQAVMRGYYVRKFKIPRLKVNMKTYKLITEEFLRKTLYNKIIPDIVIEVITFNKYHQDLSLYSDKHRVYLRVIDDLLNNVIKRMSQEVVKEQTNYLVTRFNILNQRMQNKPETEKDPMKLLTLVLIQNFIQKEVFIIAKESIRDQSSDYFKDLQYNKIIKDILIPNTVRYVVFEALDEIIMEQYLDSVINNLIKELANPLASHMYELIVAEQESFSLDVAMQNYIYRLIGDTLIEHLLLQMQDEQQISSLFSGQSLESKIKAQTLKKQEEEERLKQAADELRKQQEEEERIRKEEEEKEKEKARQIEEKKRLEEERRKQEEKRRLEEEKKLLDQKKDTKKAGKK